DQVPPLPGWYVTHPDDIDLYKYSRTEGNPDMGHYQLLPYGNGQGFGQDVGYNFFNPAPVDGRLAPQPTGGVAPGSYGNGNVGNGNMGSPYPDPGYGEVPYHPDHPGGVQYPP